MCNINTKIFYLLFLVTPYFTNAQIEWVTNLKIKKIGIVTSSYAAVQKDKKWGIIDVSGAEKVPFAYDKIVEIRSTTCNVQKKGLWGIYDIANNKELASCEQTSIIRYYNNSFMAIPKNEKWAIYNFLTKKYITDFIYEGFEDFSDRIKRYDKGIVGKRNNKAFFIEEDGSESSYIEPQSIEIPNPPSKSIDGYINTAHIMRNNTWIVENKNNKFGIVDENNKIVLDTIYDSIIDDQINPIEIEKEGLKSFIDLQGNLLCPLSEKAHFYNTPCGQRITYNVSSKFICNDIEGKPINATHFDVFQLFHNSKFGYKAEKNKYTFIDCNGNTIISLPFQGIEPFGESFFIKKGKYWDIGRIKID